MIATAPAKVILSGEHAVVYGAPALAAAVQRYARCQVTALGRRDRLALSLPDLSIERALALSDLTDLRQQVLKRHAAYLAGQLTIDKVATADELLWSALGEWLHQYSPGGLQQGLRIRLSSSIPLGSGMGSSAAVCTSLVASVSAFCGRPLARDALQALVTRVEALQHGRSSGLDPALSVRGGVMRFCCGDAEPLAAALPGRWWLANSGTPRVSTGECVELIRQRFGSSTIWQRFAAVTAALEQGLRQQDRAAIAAAIRTNHRLLTDIGVVPDRVQQCIDDIEAAGGAAKISGAGAVTGDAGGLILVYHPHNDVPPALPAEYQLMDLELDSYGTRVRN
ncbi:mevalonate kinase family protein [Motiliproteus sediminis]|uniref:mevalonate kinase family protein n=1 Tax=Motiliproteus sediminis TaxID=1468178 RepID=UPI001AEFD3D6|nr:mevalonate kinase [Motiliproteus sediminis]